MKAAPITTNIDSFVNHLLQDNLIHMKYKETEKHFFMDFHSHEGYEIYFFHTGTGYFLVEDQIFPLQGNDLILIGEHQSHKSSPELGTPNTRTVIHFLPELLDPVAKDWLLEIFHHNTHHRHIRLWDSAVSRFLTLAERLHLELSARPRDLHYALRVNLNELLFELHRIVFDDVVTVKEPSPGRKVNPKIEQAVKFLSNHYRENLTLEVIAGELYINENYLCHLFKSTVGITITEFLLQTRIHHAKSYLLFTDLTISEIGEKVGFGSSSYFGQAFKAKTGMSPRDFRKAQRPQSPPSGHM